ncbi:hypothetical protein B0H14DRAFT_2575743 [Mycena olivaceomarginata]|nr:hypothetical protein B0H14DRAFT_2575743 [Mycena olivaceomarginata]
MSASTVIKLLDIGGRPPPAVAQVGRGWQSSGREAAIGTPIICHRHYRRRSRRHSQNPNFHRYWHKYQYNAIREFFEAKSFDPYNQDFTRLLGLPLADMEPKISPLPAAGHNKANL